MESSKIPVLWKNLGGPHSGTPDGVDPFRSQSPVRVWLELLQTCSAFLSIVLKKLRPEYGHLYRNR